MKSTVAPVVGLSLVATCLVGCLNPVEEPEIPPDAPVVLYPEARRLSGASPETIVARADHTVTREPMDTQSIRRVSESSRRAVVSIYAKTKTQVEVLLLPIRLPGPKIKVNLPGLGLGTGFFVDSSGLILTNDHVIRGTEEVHALTYEGEDYPLEIVARDPVYDLALLRVVAGPGGFETIPMGRSDELDVGEVVIAVGNPLGFGHTVTQGIISQTGRHLREIHPEEGREVAFIQTDTASNPGSSGGPLITLTGAWIGVNTAGITEAQNINFAVPSSQVEEFLADVVSGNGVQAR